MFKVGLYYVHNITTSVYHARFVDTRKIYAYKKGPLDALVYY